MISAPSTVARPQPPTAAPTPAAVLVPIADVRGVPGRKLNREELASSLRGFRDGAYFKPVPAYHDAKARVFDLRDGTHRWRCSLAYGFTQIPCLLLTLDERLRPAIRRADGP